MLNMNDIKFLNGQDWAKAKCINISSVSPAHLRFSKIALILSPSFTLRDTFQQYFIFCCKARFAPQKIRCQCWFCAATVQQWSIKNKQFSCISRGFLRNQQGAFFTGTSSNDKHFRVGGILPRYCRFRYQTGLPLFQFRLCILWAGYSETIFLKCLRLIYSIHFRYVEVCVNIFIVWPEWWAMQTNQARVYERYRSRICRRAFILV